MPLLLEEFMDWYKWASCLECGYLWDNKFQISLIYYSDLVGM